MVAYDLMMPGEVAVVFAVHPSAVTRWANERLLGHGATDGGHRRYPRHVVAGFFPGGEIVPVLTIEQAASILDVAPARVRSLGKLGCLPTIRTPGGHRRFIKSSVESYAIEHASGGAQ